MSVIPFARPTPPAPAETERTATGPVRCHSADCGHVWRGVAPVGTVNMECPKCGDHKGHWRFEFSPEEGDMVRECQCGQQLFYITPEGHMCANCGTYQEY